MTHSDSQSASRRASVKHRSRVLVPFMVAIFVVAAALLLNALLGRMITLNMSPSVALGLYITCHHEPRFGELVEFELAPEFRSTIRSHNQSKRDARVLKPIAAGPGDHIDTTGDWLLINERCVAPIFTVDSQGRPLPVWRARRVLRPGEFFVFSACVPNSFDSRYYGPIRRCDIIAVRRPLWTWNDGSVSDAGRNP